MNTLQAIDLFCGAGGLSYGFQEEGYHISLGVDSVQIALETFKKNHTNSEALLLDLHESESINLIVNHCKIKNTDVIIGGPPCQGFSLTGTRNENDKRNTLFRSFLTLAEHIKPKAFVIENVPGIMTLYNGKVKTEILKKCNEMGYNCTVKLLYAPDYGIPQIRKRVFFVALKKQYGVFEFPEPTHKEDEYIGCHDAIGDLPDLENTLGDDILNYTQEPFSEYQIMMRKNCDLLYNHVGTKHTDHVIETISYVPEGGNHKDLPQGMGETRKFNEAWTRYHSQKPSKTIDTGHRNHFHYKYNRVPTVRENARLQSFPDDFIFLGNKTEQNRQVGNAVPPLLGRVIAKQLAGYI